MGGDGTEWTGEMQSEGCERRSAASAGGGAGEVGAGGAGMGMGGENGVGGGDE
jgi:hypothetical protein